jgi:SRSO17 transposase
VLTGLALPRRPLGADTYERIARPERKNGWTIAELAGDATPDGMQRLLNFYSWSAGEVRDDLRAYVAAAIGGVGGVLIPDETGFLKKGTKSAGVARQYSGTAGRIENCQVGVFLAYAVPGVGRALIDRELYLPRAWTDDRDRCRQAGIPDDRRFATKPELARQMINRALEAGMPFGWVATDEVYGQNGPLRDWLEERHVSYVLAVPKSFPGGDRRRPGPRGPSGRAGARSRVAAGVLRRRVEGTPVLRLGADRHHRPGPSPAGPPAPDAGCQGRARAGVLDLPRPSRHRAG